MARLVDRRGQPSCLRSLDFSYLLPSRADGALCVDRLPARADRTHREVEFLEGINPGVDVFGRLCTDVGLLHLSEEIFRRTGAERHSSRALKVSPCFRSPVSNPFLNQRTRCAE